MLDTDVVVAALRSPQGASAALLRCIDRGLCTFLLSVPLALEYEAICQLPEHRLAAGLSMKDVNTFLKYADRLRGAGGRAFPVEAAASRRRG